jgi:hypothetical protein
MGTLDDTREARANSVRRERESVVAQLLAYDAVTRRASVSIDGSQPISLPAAPGDYTGYTTVLCLCNPTDGGRATRVMFPVGVQADPPPAPVAPGGAAASATILPASTGSWRTNRGILGWDKYTGGDGALSDLYQGPAAAGGGNLIGLACYGAAVAGLGATTITAVTVSITRVGTGATAPVTLTVQGSPNGARPAGAPSASGDTASVSLTRGASGLITLTAPMCEALRTGAAQGLCLVGGAYAGAKGITRGDGMALHILYTRPA